MIFPTTNQSNYINTYEFDDQDFNYDEDFERFDEEMY
jgi:hypothetical protein